MDSLGNSASATFAVEVRDTTEPLLVGLMDRTFEATSPAGAVALYFPPLASDVVDLNPLVVCSPAHGATVPLGTTRVACTATDDYGNVGTGTLRVNVQDTQPPTLQSPGQVIAEATGPSGAVVSYDIPASDIADDAVAVTCSSASGSTFPLGTTAVECVGVDDSGNSNSVTLLVTVRDTTPPRWADVPAETILESPDGSAVPLEIPAVSDLVDVAPAVSCNVPGGTLGLGRHDLRCTATDDAGNMSLLTFTVIVRLGPGPGSDTTGPGSDTTGPHIEPAINVNRSGKRITNLVLTTSEPLDAAIAQTVASYELADGRTRRPLRLAGVLYDSNAGTITLVPAKSLKTNRLYLLTARRSLTDVAGNALDNNRDGIADDFVLTVGLGTKLSFRDADGDTVSLTLKGGGTMRLTRRGGANEYDLLLEDTIAGRSILAGKVKRARSVASDGVVTLNSLTLAGGARIQSRLANPPFRIGPLSQQAIDELLLASAGTLAGVLISQG